MRHLKFLCTCVILLLTSVAVFAQTQITGHVADMKGEAIIGANVTLKGTTNGTITDFDGHFTLNVNDPNGILAVSFIGYKTKEVKIGEKTIFQIILEEDTETLDEVVVVGYGTQTKKSLTGAVSDVKSDALTRSVSTTTAGALSGKIAGISTRAVDARPGRGINLEIRNMGSPLFVIDGIPYGGMNSRDWLQASDVSGNDVFNALNIEDIESITVLKDASAAIYGLRAANGVVLVTTKKGRKNEKVSINVNGYYGWQNLTRFPKLANAGQYVRGLAEAAQNRGEDPNNLYTPEELAKWQAGTEPGYKSYDYYDMVMRKNVPQYHINANVTGGSDKTNYYLSVAHTSQDAMMRDFKYQRTNFQLNLDSKITDHFTVGAQISGKYEKSEDVGLPGGDGYYTAILAMFKMQPIESPYANDNPEYINNVHENGYNPAAFRRDIAGYKDNLTRNANINAYAQYDFKFGLTAKATFSYNYTNSRFDGYQYAYQIYTYDKANDTYNGTPATGRWRSQIDRSVPARYMQLQLNYTKQFKKHNISAVLGYEASDYDWSKKTYGTEPSTDYLPLLQFDELNSFGDEWSYEARAGWIGRINYNFAHKYLIEILARYDGSYLYAPSKRWGFFPGVSVGWRISEESFMLNTKSVVDDLKIRASYGRSGNDAVGNFQYLSGYKLNGYYLLGDKSMLGIATTGLANPNLTWEKFEIWNVGLNYSFLSRLIYGEGDVFYRKRTGIPATRTMSMSPTFGATFPQENINSLNDRGFEFMVGSSKSFKNFSYDISGNISWSRAKWDHYEEQIYTDPDQKRINQKSGQWVDRQFGYISDGLFTSQEEIDNLDFDQDNKQNTSLRPGDIRYVDVNGDKVLDWKDQVEIGKGTMPHWMYGLNVNLKYKDFDLAALFQGAFGYSSYISLWHNTLTYPQELFDLRWSENNNVADALYPRLGGAATNGHMSDYFYKKAGYLRLKSFALGYNLPKELCTKLLIQQCRVYFAGTNLFTFDKLSKYHIDPEAPSGQGGFYYPQQKTLSVGINLSF